MDTEPRIRIRPLWHGERAPLRTVFAGLSPASRYLRFHTPLPRLTAPMERLLTDVDGRRHAAVVAEVADAGGWTPLGIGRVIGTGDGVGEVAFEVVDEWHGRGIGRRLLTALRHQAAALGLRRIVALVLPQNRRAAALMRSVFTDVTTRRVGSALQLEAPIPDHARAATAAGAGDPWPVELCQTGTRDQANTWTSSSTRPRTPGWPSRSTNRSAAVSSTAA